MRLTRLVALLVPCVAAVAVAAAPSVRKDPNGVYAVLDSAVVETSSGAPDRIRLWGEFALANVVEVRDGKIFSIQLGHFHPPKRGFMYYTVDPRSEAATRADWALLRAAAGTGRLIGWGSHIPAMDTAVAKVDTAFARIVTTYNGRIRMLGEPLGSPDTFPQRMPGAAKSTGRFRGPSELGFTPRDTAAAASSVRPPS